MTLLSLNANVLFTAAHNPEGKAASVIASGNAGLWNLATSTYAQEEARRNLERKFPDVVPAFNELLTCFRVVGHPRDGPILPGLAAKDQPIFQATLACGASHLLTGDLRDFGPFMNRPEETSGIRIQTVGEFLDALRR